MVDNTHRLWKIGKHLGNLERNKELSEDMYQLFFNLVELVDDLNDENEYQDIEIDELKVRIEQ